MKYYSEITKKLYDTKDALIKAEVEATKKKGDREAAAKNVTKLLEEAREAKRKANQALDDFIKKYGSFKTTLKEEDVDKEGDNFWNTLSIFNADFPF